METIVMIFLVIAVALLCQFAVMAIRRTWRKAFLCLQGAVICLLLMTILIQSHNSAMRFATMQAQSRTIGELKTQVDAMKQQASSLPSGHGHNGTALEYTTNVVNQLTSLTNIAVSESAPIRDYPDPHHHKVTCQCGTNYECYVQTLVIKDARQCDVRRDLQPKVVWNPEKTWSASLASRRVADRNAYDGPVIIVKCSKGESLCVFSNEWLYRPLEDTAWINNRLLVFDLWTGPSYGWHYVLDVKSQKVVFVSGFSGEYGDGDPAN